MQRRRTQLNRLFEMLESRTLMPGEGDFHADINFQPAAAPVPDGYLVDAGDKFGDRGNGYTYGWSATNTANTRDRNAALSPDQLHDTLIHMQKSGTFTWELAVPNGTYSVDLVSGDATAIDSTYKINVEGKLLVDGKPSAATHWLEGTGQIEVSDGKLSVSNASGAANNKICYIDVESIELAPPGVSTIEISTPDASASERKL